MHQETGEIPLGRNYRLPRPPSGSDALQDRSKLGGRRLGQSTSSVESSRGRGASRVEAGAGPARGGSMVVHPNGAVVAVVEPSADVKSSWGRREQEAATSGMASLLLELQLLTSVPARPPSFRRPPTPRRARAGSSSPGRSSKACAEPANRRGASGGPGRPIGAARWPTGATLRPVAHPRWRIGAAAACSVEPAAVWTWRPRVWDGRDGPRESQIRFGVFVLLHYFFYNYNLVHSFFIF
jgi:hypothetical protein